MRIEIKEEKILHDGDTYLQGEVRVVDDDIGEYFCTLGWARDLDGGFENVEPNRSRVVEITVPPSRLGVAGEEVGA